MAYIRQYFWIFQIHISCWLSQSSPWTSAPYCLLAKQNRLKKKAADAADRTAFSVDEQLHCDMVTLVNYNAKLFEDLPPDSFKRIFWEQEFGTASKKNARSLCWYPLIIRLCLYLHHRLATTWYCLLNISTVVFCYINLCTNLMEHMSFYSKLESWVSLRSEPCVITLTMLKQKQVFHMRWIKCFSKEQRLMNVQTEKNMYFC